MTTPHHVPPGRAYAGYPRTITEQIADGLDASVDDRGFNEDHQRAVRLANAAPDLLAECRREAEWLAHIRQYIQAPEPILHGIDQAITYLNAAIDKATGAP